MNEWLINGSSRKTGDHESGILGRFDLAWMWEGALDKANFEAFM